MTDLVPTPSAADLDSAREFVKAALLARNPNLDLTPGSALEALLVDPEAYLAAAALARGEQLELSSSLAAIVAGLADADDAAVDRLVSNYFLTRRGDSNASGSVKLVVEEPIPYQIPAGFAFTVNGARFVTPSSFLVYPPDAVGVISGANVRRMTARPDNQFEFTITVQAEAAGPAGRLIAGTVLTIESALAGMVSAAVAADFAGGAARETNADLLARAAAGVTAKVLAGPEHIAATLAAEFAGTRVAVVGVGSPLMRRDRSNLLGISTGGKQDLWVRTSDAPRPRTLRLPGTVVNATAKRVLISVPHVESVGLLRVLAIRLADTAAFGGDLPESVTIAIDQDEPYRPALPTALDAAFSAYANLQVQFIESTSEVLTANQVRQYDVDVLAMPELASVHTFCVADGVRPAGQDILVRSAVPCSVAVQATVRVPATAITPDLVALRQAIVDTINALPFGTSSLSAFVVHRAIASLLPRGDVVDTSLRGTILAPSGADLRLPASRDLAIPERPADLVGAANTFFACSLEQVELTLVSR